MSACYIHFPFFTSLTLTGGVLRTKKINSKKQFKLPERLNLYLHIPEPIYSDERVDWLEKILWCKIHQLDQKDGCFASNKYLAEIIKTSEDWISKRISKLKKLDYLYQKSFDGRKRILRCVTPKILRQPKFKTKATSNVPISINNKEINKEIYHGKNSMGISSSKK